eukprot:216922-Pleurochrysis_carterae.AAC.2
MYVLSTRERVSSVQVCAHSHGQRTCCTSKQCVHNVCSHAAETNGTRRAHEPSLAHALPREDRLKELLLFLSCQGSRIDGQSEGATEEDFVREVTGVKIELSIVNASGLNGTQLDSFSDLKDSSE